MDGQEYLNQISRQSQPVGSSGGGGGILKSKLFIVGIVGVVLLILIIIIGAVLGGNKGGEKNLTFALKLHLDNTAEVVQSYQPAVKSSDLRSKSASFYSVLSNTSREITDYITEKYDFKEKDLSEKMTQDAQTSRDELEADLFSAKIGGTLDRVFALKMAYEILLINAEEAKIIDATKDENLTQILVSSYNSLENLYNNFNNFSESN